MKIAQIVGGVLTRFPDILRAMAMPLIVMLVLDALIYTLVGPDFFRAGLDPAEPANPRLLQLLFLEGLVGLWTGVIVPVRWHRYVVSGDLGFQWWTFPLGAREWGYFGWLILSMLIVAALMIIPGMMLSALWPAAAAGAGMPATGFLIALLLLAVVVSSLWLGAFGLVLPAAAIERPIGGFAGSLEACRPHYRRFAGRILVMTAIGFGVTLILGQVGWIFAGWWGIDLVSVLVLSTTNILGAGLGMALSTTALSFNYGEAVSWPGQRGGQPVPQRGIFPS